MRRVQHIGFVVVGTLGTLLVGACGASSSRPLGVEPLALPAKLPTESTSIDRARWIPGETMSFDISMRKVVAGEAVLAVGSPGVVGDKAALIVRSRTQSTGVLAMVKEVRDEIVTWLDPETGQVVQHEADSRYGAKRSILKTDLGNGVPGSFKISYERLGRAKIDSRQSLPANAIALDSLAALGVLRAWSARQNEEASYFILSGRRLWRTRLRAQESETIRTTMGKHPAIRIDGVAQQVNRVLKDTSKEPRNFTIWLSDDSNRLPLLILASTDYGDLRVELTDYTRPDRRRIFAGP